MDRSSDSNASQLEQWAARQLADFDARNPGTLFAEGLVLDVDRAYALQSAVSQLRRQRGEQVIGYKVGCTSPAIRTQLGIDHCVTGRLYDSEQYTTGAVLSRKNFANLAIEGELAIELSREPTVDDFSGTEMPQCIARVFPVIELHHHVMRGHEPSPGELIANNAIHAGVVAGSGIKAEAVAGTPKLAVYSDDQLLENCDGASLVETISSSLAWLIETLSASGDHLRAGQIVLTGSIPSLFPVHDDCRIRVETTPFGCVEATFIA